MVRFIFRFYSSQNDKLQIILTDKTYPITYKSNVVINYCGIKAKMFLDNLTVVIISGIFLVKIYQHSSLKVYKAIFYI